MVQLKFFGLGGQGVVTAAKVLSHAVSLYENKYAITVPSYGHERRGAPVYTSIIIDEDPVLLNCFVYEPDIVLAMDDGLPDKGVDLSAGIRPGSILVINSTGGERLERYRRMNFASVRYVDATRIALGQIGKGIPNGAMLGALAGTGVVSIESIERAIDETFGPKAGPKNRAAAREAYEHIRQS